MKFNSLTLIKNSEAGDIPENIFLEFKSILKETFLKNIEVIIQSGNPVNSPLELKDLENKKHHDEARKSIDEDIDIQDFIKKFDGKIKTDTIKPIK